MKKDEIPQDQSSLESKNMREVCYVIDEDGKYSTGLSRGWKPKTIALDVTIEDLKERAEEAKQLVINGEKSPIYYFMIVSKMDWAILASYMGFTKWKVKRHAKSKPFKKLKLKTMQKYASVFEIEIEQLTNFNERN